MPLFPTFLRLPWNQRKAVSSGRPKGRLAAAVVGDMAKPEPVREIDKIVTQMDKDYQVVLAYKVLSSVIKSAEVTVSSNSDDPRVQAHRDHLLDLWYRTIDSALQCIKYGRVAYEFCRDYDAEHNLSIVKDLDEMPYRETTMCLDADGNYDGFKLKHKSQEIPVDANMSWWLALDPTAREPHGRSRYLGAPLEVWQDRTETRANRRKFVRRFVIRGGVAHVPETRPNPENPAETIDVFAETQQALEALFAGGYLLFPNSRDADGNYLYDTDELDPTGLDPSPLNGVLDRQDVEMLRAFCIPEKTVIEGQAVGSYAMVTQQMAILYAVCDEILDQVIRSFQSQVVERERQWNYGEESGVTLEISFTPLSRRAETSGLSQIVQSIITSPTIGPLVLSGAVDLEAMLQASGIPLVVSNEELMTILDDIRSQQAMLPGAIGGGAVGFGQEMSAGGDGVEVAAGEFAGMSRLQQTRNFRGIESILQRVMDGEWSVSLATQYLQTLGLSPTRAKSFIDAAVESRQAPRNLARTVKKKSRGPLRLVIGSPTKPSENSPSCGKNS